MMCVRRAPLQGASNLNIGNTDARQEAAVAARLAEALAALLLEHAQLGTARLAVHHAEHGGVGDERRAGDDVSSVLFDQEHLLELEFRALLAGHPVDFDDGTGSHLELAASGLNNRVHDLPRRK